jgi:hypothetical protein
VTPLKLKIILALALTDAVVRDADIISVRTSSTSHPHAPVTIYDNEKIK